MHGETPIMMQARIAPLGLSPHARGNRRHKRACAGPSGTIPACTGKPAWPAASGAPEWDYPRMHGETGSERFVSAFERGLSPHARGNRYGCRKRAGAFGTIPACTGKPFAGRSLGPSSGDYPRMHGETEQRDFAAHAEAGLSPHARGNRGKQEARRAPGRTIPACTGKPTAWSGWHRP